MARKSAENRKHIGMTRNGSPTTTAPSARNPKSGKRKRAVDWAVVDDQGFSGFQLKPAKTAKKQRVSKSGNSQEARTHSAEITQRNPFGAGRLSDTHFVVVPEHLWESMRRYKSFTVEEFEFMHGDFIYVKGDESELRTKDAYVQGWIAHILEVRAADPSHVYIRVYWMYRPEDLPSGRLPYHGTNELIASNDMAIIDGMTVDGPANVIHWEEQEDQGETLEADQLFWRQTLDMTQNPPRLSELPKHCIDGTPCNPDDVLIQCDSCSAWLHGICLETNALREAYTSAGLGYPKENAVVSNAKTKTKRPSKGPMAFSASLSINSGSTRLTITDKRLGKNKNSWDAELKCLCCGDALETTQPNGEPTAPNVEEASGTIIVAQAFAIDEPLPPSPYTPANPPSDDGVQEDNDGDSVVDRCLTPSSAARKLTQKSTPASATCGIPSPFRKPTGEAPPASPAPSP